MPDAEWVVRPEDRIVLRELGKRFRDAATTPENLERKRLWYLHDECRGERPLILTEFDGGLPMVKPDLRLRCIEEWARAFELHMLSDLAHVEEIGDDTPLEPCINHNWHLDISNFGVETRYRRPQTDGTRGAYHIDPPLTDLARDLSLLRPRTYAVDRERTLAEGNVLREIFDGILDVRLRGNPWWTMGLTWKAIELIGLEELMLYMYDQPEALHQLLAFLRDDNLALLDWMEAEGLLNLNNENDYIGSGSRGYTRTLPQSCHQQGAPVHTLDMWTLIESQETVGVGPDLYAEFIFPYENSIAQRFGRVYYGCCEPVHTRWVVLQQMANLRRVSISPWCDEEYMAAALGNRYVYSRKPNPSLVSTEIFDEEVIRRDLRGTIACTRKYGCATEIIMKDVHTLHGDPNRLARWVAITRQEIGAE